MKEPQLNKLLQDNKAAQKGVTLIEMIVVIIILGILATLGFTNYFGVREQTLDREAISNLRAIQAAEKTYYLDTSTYYPNAALSESDIGNINWNLKLSLSEQSWDYTVWNNGCAQAIRVGIGRSWYFRITDDTGDFTDCNLDGEPNMGCYTCP